jgi:SAM-dependent methyltransferase
VGIVGGQLGYQILRHMRLKSGVCDGSAYTQESKLAVLFGPSFWDEIRGKTVIDFGCGEGTESIEMARHGATKVIGVDIQRPLLEIGRRKAESMSITGVLFCDEPTESADVVVTLDGFEHFGDPEGVLRTMATLLKPSGCIMACFGPTWYHPYGGHLFSVFPWAHLVFTEKALIRWRSDFKCDGATRFSEVRGGLNQMTIRRFRKIVAASPLRFLSFEAIPIRGIRPVHNWLTQEFLSSVVRCRLVKAA